MLIQKLTGAACATLVQDALRLAAAKSGTFSGGLFFRLLSPGALFELPEIDQFPHADLRHLVRRHVGCLRSSERPATNWRNPVCWEKLQAIDNLARVRMLQPAANRGRTAIFSPTFILEILHSDIG